MKAIIRKRKISMAFIAICFLGFTPFYATEYVVEPYASAVKPEEMTLMNRWLGFLTGNGAGADASRYAPAVPFSFVCGKRSSTEWIKPDNAEVTSGEWLEDGTRIHTLRWHDLQTKLSCEMQLTEYRNFPAMSWTVFLKNEGNADTAPIHDFKALDTYWKRTDDAMPVLYRSQGGDAREDDFFYAGEKMRKNIDVNRKVVRMDSERNRAYRSVMPNPHIDNDHRPSSTWMPFYNLQTGSDGLIVGLGWMGQWFGEIDHDGNGVCRLSSGMEHLHAKLHAGESIRSPLMLVLYWSGERMHGQNMFRQLVLSHFHPQQEGRPVSLPVVIGTWGGWHADTHLAWISKIAEYDLPYDVYWIDAGWYEGADTQLWWKIGNWTTNRQYYPNSMQPVSHAVHKANMKFLLWFESEGAQVGNGATLEHPEWYYSFNDPPVMGESVLLNYAHPDAKKYITETVSNRISEYGIDILRDDHNTNPFPYFVHKETEDRAGMREIRYVENIYDFYDEMLRRHPGLMIDNCSSGGRRIELEMMKRSVPLWRTDYSCITPYFMPEAVQAQTFNLAHWVPGSSAATKLYPLDGDTYLCRSALSAGLDLSFNDSTFARNDEKIWTFYRDRINEAKQAQPFFYGDFYPLTTGNYSLESWIAYHLYLPEKKEGLLIAFRRPKSDVVSMTFDLTTIKPDAKYEFEDVDTGKKVTLSGNEIRKNGYTLKTDAPRESRLVYYRQVN